MADNKKDLSKKDLKNRTVIVMFMAPDSKKKYGNTPRRKRENTEGRGNLMTDDDELTSEDPLASNHVKISRSNLGNAKKTYKEIKTDDKMNKEEFVRKWGHLFSMVKDLSSIQEEGSGSQWDKTQILMLRDAISVIEDNN